ncbi:hypothetical protein H8356DRAFT_1701549 [Neocallimastix lanati (nom. inval.)]|jgi:hypothetical protein|nr:hypothetical protein H8356DRAFT_1701549 [Neocallimastix sp. JGI-2020a]
MKTINIFFVLSLITTFLISTIQALSEGSYLVYVSHTFSDNKSAQFKEFINSVCDEIHELIVQNKDSYHDPSQLDKMEKEFEANKDFNIKTYGNSPYVYPISTTNERTCLYAYLTSTIIDKVKQLPFVKSISPNQTFTYDDSTLPERNDSASNPIKCTSEKLGYPCCSSNNNKVYYTDNDGDWGFDENTNNWCGLTPYGASASQQVKTCWSERLGYSCCQGCQVVEVDNDGNWGIENDQWCGIPLDRC